MKNNIEKLYDHGQSVWCDHISRPMIDTGKLQRLIDLGVVGVTSNPTIFMKAITGGKDYDRPLHELLGQGLDRMEVYEGLVLPDIADAADRLRPVYDRTEGVDGFVSLEVNPKLAYDTAATIAEGRRLFHRLERPNVLIKVPATEVGIPAIEALIGEGVSVNVTLIFGLGPYEKVIQAYLAGLRRLDQAGGDLCKTASVASFFVSRVDTLVDQLLEEKKTAGAAVDHLLGRAAIANAKLAYHKYQQVFETGKEFTALAARGARVQRCLWASTSAKNPAYPDTKYVDGLVGRDTVNTLPPVTIQAALDHGCVEPVIHQGTEQAHALFDELAKLDIPIDAVTEKLRTDGVALFAQSFDELLAVIDRKQQSLRAVG